MNIEKFLKDKGIVRNKQQANYIMIAVIILCLIYIFANMFGGNKSSGTELTPEEIDMMMQGENSLYNQQNLEQTQPKTEEELYY